MVKVPTLDVFAKIDFQQSGSDIGEWLKIGTGVVVSDNIIELTLRLMPTNMY